MKKYDANQIAEILEKAAEFMCDGGWCKDAWGITAEGRKTDYDCKDAVKRCPRSAIALFAEDGSPEFRLAVHAVLDHVHRMSMICWNDGQDDAAPVIAAFLETAKELRKRNLPLYTGY